MCLYRTVQVFRPILVYTNALYQCPILKNVYSIHFSLSSLDRPFLFGLVLSDARKVLMGTICTCTCLHFCQLATLSQKKIAARWHCYTPQTFLLAVLHTWPLTFDLRPPRCMQTLTLRRSSPSCHSRSWMSCQVSWISQTAVEGPIGRRSLLFYRETCTREFQSHQIFFSYFVVLCTWQMGPDTNICQVLCFSIHNWADTYIVSDIFYYRFRIIKCVFTWVAPTVGSIHSDMAVFLEFLSVPRCNPYHWRWCTFCI